MPLLGAVGYTATPITSQPIAASQPVAQAVIPNSAQSLPGSPSLTGPIVPPTAVFSGSSLPDGWTVDTGTGGSYTMVGDRIRLGIASGTSKDSIFPGSTVDASVGPVGPCPDIDFDIAVEVGTDIHVQRGVGFGFFVKVGAATWVRASWYCQDGMNGGLHNLIRTEYSAYTTDGVTITQVTGSNTQTGNLFDGGPSWFGLKRSGSTWTSYVSGDGTTWRQERSWTAAVKGVSAIKFGLMNTTTTTPAKSFDVFRVIDVSAQADPRPVWAKTTHINTLSSDFSSGTIPSWLSTLTNAGGTASIVSNKLRLSHSANTNRSYATVASNGAATPDQGLLCQIQQVANPIGGPYFDPGVMSNTTGVGNVDQYSPAGGATYIFEMPGGTFDGTLVRAVRRTPSPDAYTFYSMATTASTGFESAYTHMVGDTGGQTINFANPIWMRVEYADGRFRCRWWQGLLSAEPSTWYWDGLDRISQNAAGGIQTLNWAHNDAFTATAGTDSVDVLYVEIYDLVASIPPTSIGSLSLDGPSTASASAANVGSLSLDGAVAPTVSDTAIGALNLIGTPTPEAVATTTGALTLSGSVAATTRALAVGALNLTGTVTGTAAVVTTGTLNLTGTATFQAPPATGLLSLTGTVTPQASVVVTAGTLSLTGSAGAAALISTTGNLTLTGSVTPEASATAVGSLSLIGTASPAASVTALGSLTLSGTATTGGAAVSVAAAFNGVGTLGAATSVAVAVASSLTAAGTLGAGTIATVLPSAAFNGITTLGASSFVTTSVAAVFTATGTLGVAASVTVSPSAAFSAIGTLGASATIAAGPLGAAFNGVGVLGAAATVAIPIAAAFTASGTLGAAATVTVRPAAAFVATGTLGTAAFVTTAVAAAFSGTGTLGAPVISVTVLPLAAFAATGTLGAAATVGEPAAATFIGTGSLGASIGTTIAAAFTGVGTFGSTAAITIFPAVAFNGVATLGVAVVAIVRPSAAFSAIGTLGADSTVKTTVAAVFAAIGTLGISPTILVPVSATFVATGSLGATIIVPPNVAAAFAGVTTFATQVTARITEAAAFMAFSTFGVDTSVGGAAVVHFHALLQASRYGAFLRSRSRWTVDLPQ